ncbi:MAG: hypothetical protein IKK45_08350 [Akkermansia sp.]|nr:hypothetical protein [Akkermansia sp.]
MPHSFEEAIERLLQKDDTYPADAYYFLREALDNAALRYGKTPQNPHLSAEELYFGFCSYALDEYGPLAEAIMESWGVDTSEDVGQMVYNLISIGIFGKQDSDRQSDFHGLPDVGLLLDAPYASLPTP